MLLSLNWMKDYLELDVDDMEFASRMSLTGSHAESVINHSKDISGIVVGRIKKIEAHPKADRLVVCKVDIGYNVLTIVTGAKNMKEKDLVLVAQDGAELADGTKIKTSDFRGVVSEGMFCSYKELGFEDNVIPKEYKDGILIIKDHIPVGATAQEALLMNDSVIEFEITPNRPDCLSVLGMIREAGATFKKQISYPDISLRESGHDIEDYFKGVTIETEGCQRYVARVIYDVKIDESPLWMQQRLIQSGMRPMNNMVDITNYVMLELGQPVHAFDLDRIQKEIVVRDAFDLAEMITLDNAKRELKPKDVIITDGQRPLALAGVMGGLDSEVEENTKVVLLESAAFSPERVRQTSKRLALRSEASSRFEKGLSPELCLEVSNRVCHLVERLGVGKIAKGYLDIYPDKQEKTVIEVNPDRMNRLLGLNLDPGSMKQSLESLDCVVEVKSSGMLVHVPSFRMDLRIEADIAEEIGRLYGFHNIPTKPLSGALTIGRKTDERVLKDKIKRELYALGFSEALSYSFISPKVWDKLYLSQEDLRRNAVRLINPLGDDFSIMRTSLLPNMLDNMQRNQNVKVDEFALYELGHVFFPRQGEPLQETRLTMGMYGARVEFYTLKDCVEKLLDSLGITKRKYILLEDNPTFHSGRTARIMVDDECIGIIGEVDRKVMESYELSKRVYIAEFYFEKLFKQRKKEIVYQEVSKYPAIERDIAFVVEKDLFSENLEDEIRIVGGESLASVELFDIYVGGHLDTHLKSMAYKLRFQRMDRTLRDEEVEESMQEILIAMQEKFGAKLRA